MTVVPDQPVAPWAWRAFAVDTQTLTLGSVTSMGGANRLPPAKQRAKAGHVPWQDDAMEKDDQPGGWAKGAFTNAVCNAQGSGTPPLSVQLSAMAARDAGQPFDWQADVDQADAKAVAERQLWVAKHTDPSDGAVTAPGPDCTCGLHATIDLQTIHKYLRPDSPVLAIVENGGRLTKWDLGYKSEQAKIMAIVLLDDVLLATLGKRITPSLLIKIAAEYGVPAIVPVSVDPEAHRELVAEQTPEPEPAEQDADLDGSSISDDDISQLIDGSQGA
jgi:hypothetical protein